MRFILRPQQQAVKSSSFLLPPSPFVTSIIGPGTYCRRFAYGIGPLLDASPQVFIVDRQGAIVWFDERLRYQHEPERFIRELDEAIGRALAPTGS